MTKKQALANYRDFWNDFVQLRPEFAGDKPAKRENWGIYIDALCKSGQITQRQYDTWTNPF